MLDAYPGSRSSRRPLRTVVSVSFALALSGCAGARPVAVSPNEIPTLEQQLVGEPQNAGVLLRYAAALFASGQCDSAMSVARSGANLAPHDALAPLVIGQCLERDREWEQALDTYRAFLAAHADRRGAPTVRARQVLVQRARANERAQVALAHETELAQQAADPQTVAVLPLDIVGDSTYQPLSRGLAQILTSDLALLQRFRLVERLQVGALIDEMALAETGAVDRATAARVGRLLQAGRMVQGLAAIPPEGEARLEASVVVTTGEVSTPSVQRGRVRDLLRMEKQLVVDLAQRMGYLLSEAELRVVLENGTQNLAAFLAYSRGLVAEDRGDYRAAAAYFAEAVRQDPGFEAARTELQSSTVTPEVMQAAPTDITTLATETVSQPALIAEPPLGSVVASTIGDIAATQSEQVSTLPTQPVSGTQTTTSQPPPTPTVVGTTLMGTVRIFFRLP